MFNSLTVVCSHLATEPTHQTQTLAACSPHRLPAPDLGPKTFIP